MTDLERDNMDDYARSIGTQEGYRGINDIKSIGSSLSSVNIWGEAESKPRPTTPTNPTHYQNADKKFEHRFVAKAWGLDYYLGCATKYIARCGKKSSVGMSDSAKEIQDLEKAMVYLQFRIDELNGVTE
tara:strand:- start:15840 stop:16226 length:387 start_codon:yes stop_codon:yes gene_type:complete